MELWLTYKQVISVLNGGSIIYWYIGFTGNRMHVFWSVPSLSSVVLLSSMQNRIVCCIQPILESQLKQYDWETAEEYPNWSHLWKQTKSKLESLRSLADIDRSTETPCLQDISPQILYRMKKLLGIDEIEESCTFVTGKSMVNLV